MVSFASMRESGGRIAVALLALLVLTARAAFAEEINADVVILVDTSISMAEPGMDPERTSLLVSKLFSDIVPGRLAVIRLLDLKADEAMIPREQTGKSVPCEDDPAKMCNLVRVMPDALPKTRRELSGALIRPSRGDAGFRGSLDNHLVQRSNNSMFQFAFAAAAGVFDKGGGGLPRTVIWLSDGLVPENNRSESETTLAELKKMGVDVRPIIFGKGNPGWAKANGLQPRTASGPRELVEAFTDAFRNIVQAPYNAPVSAQSASFEIKPLIEEAWVIVYGDASLRSMEVSGPGGTVRGDHAADAVPSAGAYRVAYMRDPKAGQYRMTTAGGGANVFYGVVQRSSLAPYMVSKEDVTAGRAMPLVVALRTRADGPNVSAKDLADDIEMTAELQGQKVTLHDDGKDGDQTAGDGLFSTMVTVNRNGETPVKLRARNRFIDRGADGRLRVTGYFRYSGPPAAIDLGSFKAGNSGCAAVRFSAQQEGAIGFSIAPLNPPPDGHSWELRKGSQTYRVGGTPIPFDPGEEKTICLVTSRGAASSSGNGEPVLTLMGGDGPDARVTIGAKWNVTALSFWERWLWLILIILAIIALAVIVYGYIKPYRFSRELALSFAQDYGDLDDQIPQPLASWRSVKIGFYRNAKAFLHPDFRVLGNRPKGAIAMLEASANRSAVVRPMSGNSVYRETSDGDWEAVPPQGKRAHNGDIYRVGDQGPHFRIVARLTK